MSIISKLFEKPEQKEARKKIDLLYQDTLKLAEEGNSWQFICEKVRHISSECSDYDFKLNYNRVNEIKMAYINNNNDLDNSWINVAADMLIEKKLTIEDICERIVKVHDGDDKNLKHYLVKIKEIYENPHMNLYNADDTVTLNLAVLISKEIDNKK